MHATNIALELEGDRLRRRLRRMELVTSALRDRASYRQAVSGRTPAPLLQAIAGFESEIAGMRDRLNELGAGGLLAV